MVRQTTLKDFKLSKSQLWDLFKVSTSIYWLARHDVNTLLFGIQGQVQLSRRETAWLEESTLSAQEIKPKLSKLKTRAELTEALTRRLADAFEMYLKPYSESDVDKEQRFTSRPFEIINAIRDHLVYPEIAIGRTAPRTLEIPFPRGVLFGILSELITNAGKPSQTDRKVIVNWEIQGRTFKCEVHDNGPGINNTLGNKFVPLDVLHLVTRNPEEPQGLHIIDRVLRVANGLLLFSKSKRLGGTVVHLEFPVASYFKDGKLNG